MTGAFNMGKSKVIPFPRDGKKDEPAKVIFCEVDISEEGEGRFVIVKNDDLWPSGKKPQKTISAKGYVWNKTIFCQFDNLVLKRAIEKIAVDMGCRVCYGEPHSFDIIFTPYFVAVVDRSTIRGTPWKAYLRYRKESRDRTSIIIVDDLKDIKTPKSKYIKRTGPKDLRVIRRIILESNPQV